MKKINIFIISVLSGIAGIIYGKRSKITVLQKAYKACDKYKSYYAMLNQWLVLKHLGKSLTEYFLNENYLRIGIYGMGEMGRRLIDELDFSKVKIEYVIDRSEDMKIEGVNFVSLEYAEDNIDAIIVTAVFAFDEIKNEISQRLTCPIISLEDIIYEL